jgi:gluconokinase
MLVARVLAIDIGTSSIRATLYRPALQPLRRGAQTHYRWRVAVDGSVETPMSAIERSLADAIDAALDGTDAPVDAVGIAAFWHSLVGVDARGRAVTGVIPWTDTRSAEEVERLRDEIDEHAVHARTGCRLHTSYLPARLRWFRRHDRKTFNRVHRWMSLPAFIERLWLGRDAESISQASGTGMFLHSRTAWDDELCRACAVSPDQLGPIVDLDDDGAELSASMARRWPQLRHARWVPAAGDGAVNDLGAGCTTAGRTALMIGTSGALRQMWTTDAAPDVPFGLWRYWLDRRRVVVGGALSNGGNLVAWMRQTLRPEGVSLSADEAARVRAVETRLARMAPDSHKLTMLPFLAGERSPDYLPHARAAIVGLTLATTANEIARAGLEAVAYRFLRVRDELAKVTPVTRLVATGTALSVSRVWPQILADALGSPIALPREAELTSRGAAILALERLGLAPRALEPSVARVFHPDARRHATYRAAAERQEQLMRVLHGTGLC